MCLSSENTPFPRFRTGCVTCVNQSDRWAHQSRNSASFHAGLAYSTVRRVLHFRSPSPTHSYLFHGSFEKLPKAHGVLWATEIGRMLILAGLVLALRTATATF